MNTQEAITVNFYIATAVRWYSEADLAENIPIINEIIELDEVTNREVYGTLSIIYNGQELLGPPYATNLFSLPNASILLDNKVIDQLFFRDSSTLTDYWLSLRSERDRNVLLYTFMNSRREVIHQSALPLMPFVRSYVLCQMRNFRLNGFIGDAGAESYIRNWWEIDWPDPSTKDEIRGLVGYESARYVMEADLDELLSSS